MAEAPRFPMYRVTPSAGWSALRPNKGILARDLARLTTFMRLTLMQAMHDAITESSRTARLRSRKGAIFNSIRTGLQAKGTRYPGTVSVTFNMRPWVAIHETGGTVRGKPYMTLPMPDALRVDGSPKRRSASGWKDYGSFIYTARSGNKFIVYRSKTQDRLVFLYLLVDKVVLKKRLFLRQAILNQEAAVVNAWSAAALEMFQGIDVYGMAFEGLTRS